MTDKPPKKTTTRTRTRPRHGGARKKTGRQPKQPPPGFDAAITAALEEDPTITDRALRLTIGGGVAYDTWLRWKVEREGTPDDIELKRARARQKPLKRVDDAMLRAAEADGNAAAAKLMYERLGGFEERDAARQAAAKAGAPAFNFTLNVTTPQGETTRLIKDIRGELEAATSGPGALTNQRTERMLPGSSFLKHPGDDAIVIQQRPAPAPDHAAAAPGSPDPEPSAPKPEQSTRG